MCNQHLSTHLIICSINNWQKQSHLIILHLPTRQLTETHLMKQFYLLAVKAVLALLVSYQLQAVVLRLRKQEHEELKIWEVIFEQIYRQQRQGIVKNEFMKDDFNQSRYNVIESPLYCHQSDAYKVVHPDVLFKDMYVWRDYTATNLQKRIVLQRTYAALPNLKTFKKAGLKFSEKFPVELTYIYTSVSTLWNNYHWGRGLGCTFQKYNHLPGKSSVSQKSLLINNFMDSIKKLRDREAGSECIRNASFIPDTFRLNDKEDCLAFFQQLNSEEHQARYKKYGPQFIIKTNEHRGEGITVLFEEEKREIMVKYDNGEKCGKDNKVAIAQKYISNPFLYKGHKIEFRIYFFIESTMPVIAYSYKRALIKRCAKPFSVHSTDKAAHVCNTAIVTKTTGLKEDYHKNDVEGEVEEEEFFIDWNLEGLQELLIKEGRISNEMWLDEYLYPRIHRSLIHMVRSTYYTFVRDSRFGEFFAVDFLLDDDLEVWVLEVNYNPQVLAVTPDRILRNFKMVEDTLEIQFAYVRSKYLRLVAYLKQHIYYQIRENGQHQFWSNHFETLMQLQKDRLEPSVRISPNNLYEKIIDEGLPGTLAYGDLIQSHCL